MSKYKKINLMLLVVVISATIFSYYLLGVPCGGDFECRYDFKKALLQPLFTAGQVLIVILSVMMIVPTNIHRKWLWYVLPVGLLATTYFVSEVSVYSSGILSLTRAHAAEWSMYALAIFTTFFVGGHLLYQKLNQ